MFFYSVPTLRSASICLRPEYADIWAGRKNSFCRFFDEGLRHEMVSPSDRHDCSGFGKGRLSLRQVPPMFANGTPLLPICRKPIASTTYLSNAYKPMVRGQSGGKQEAGKGDLCVTMYGKNAKAPSIHFWLCA